MAKRAQTEHSFVVGMDKPAGMTSHDVVNACRRIYGERRIGHAGTLDPAATGVLIVCVGPATRLDRYLVGHDKVYEFACVFGKQTDTDDAEGEVVASEPVPERVLDFDYAREALSWMVGPAMQIPPAYSSIKVDGKVAHREARAGRSVALEPRSVVVHAMDLMGIDASDPSEPVWHVRAHVSSGTYVRSLARDLGHTVGTCAHVGSLRRTRSGSLDVSACVGIDALADDPFRYVLDPVKLLGVRVLFADDRQAMMVANGAPIPAKGASLFGYDKCSLRSESYCACTSGIVGMDGALTPGETIAIVVDNRLVALYSYDSSRNLLKSSCGFSIGVKRGSDL